MTTMSIEDGNGTIGVSQFGTHYDYAHGPIEENIDRAHTGDQSVDYIAFTGVIVSAHDHDGRQVFRERVPARTVWRAATGGGTRADRAGYHDEPPTDEQIAAAVARARDVLAHPVLDGARLRRRRVALGLSQDKLARGLGVEANTVARWERGAKIANPRMIGLALDALEQQRQRG